ncbi:MAG: precorrin-3B C(17)-methyltransferase [Planctomycetes bacterium]|nr:precorrin-3B C(17)-methyltransferase [Planctomycetota bacterium]
MQSSRGLLSIVGIGPGCDGLIAPQALGAIAEADLVVGYSTYIKLVKHLLKDKCIVRTGMTEEIARARAAIDEARKGRKVTVISSGDAGVYGMCSLVFGVLQEDGWTRDASPELRIVPGISAINACASLVGAPLGHDFCAISLSDLLTPWQSIRKKIDRAADADFVIGLYNPASGRRQRQIVEAQEIIAKYRSGTTPVAIVKSAYRKQQSTVICNLDNFLDYEIGMNTTVLVGSTQTIVYDGFMVTPRGYANKYTWEGEVLEGQQPARSLNPDMLPVREDS